MFLNKSFDLTITFKTSTQLHVFLREDERKPCVKKTRGGIKGLHPPGAVLPPPVNQSPLPHFMLLTIALPIPYCSLPI